MTKEQLGNLIIASEDTMYHVAKTLLYSDADCADAIQEAIVKAFSSIHTLRRDACAKTWLVCIVINECYTIMRCEKKLVPLEDYAMDEAAEERADYSDLYEALSHLSEEIRLTVTLLYGGLQRQGNRGSDEHDRERGEKPPYAGEGKDEKGTGRGAVRNLRD